MNSAFGEFEPENVNTSNEETSEVNNGVDWNDAEMDYRNHFLYATGGAGALISNERYKILAVDIRDVAPPCEGCESECHSCNAAPVTYVVHMIEEPNRPNGCTYIVVKMELVYEEVSREFDPADESYEIDEVLNARVSLNVFDDNQNEIPESEYTHIERYCVDVLHLAVDEHFLAGPRDTNEDCKGGCKCHTDET